jgi:Cu/Ag efflux protein CusF
MFVAGALAFGLGASPAFAQAPGGEMNPPAPTKSASQVTHMSGTITAIDKSARTVTIKGADDGQKHVIDVPSDMTGFEKLKVGDKVDADYYESVTLSLLPPGTKPSMNEQQMRQRSSATSGMAGKTITASATVVSVDAAQNKVTLKGPRGQVQTVSVQDPELQAKLANLKPGQVIQITYTEALAASIRPAGK